MVRTRRACGDLVMSAGALVVLLVALAAFDDRVREQLSLRFSSTRPSTELVSAGERIRDLVTFVLETVRYESVEHAPLMIFVLAATVLVLFMLRL